jgi:hypothetical protein
MSFPPRAIIETHNWGGGVWTGTLKFRRPNGQETTNQFFLKLEQNGSSVTSPTGNATLEGHKLRLEMKPPNPPDFTLQLEV